jgi:hypothetical protein
VNPENQVRELEMMMRYYVILRTTTIFLLLASCVSAQEIKTHSDSDYDLAPLRKFAFVPLNSTDPLAAQPKLAETIESNLKTQLERIGMTEDDAHPDFLVKYSATEQNRTSTYGTFATGVTAQNESWTVEYKVGTLNVDMLVPQSKRTMWKASATETAYWGNLQKYFSKGAEKIIRAFYLEQKKERKRS